MSAASAETGVSAVGAGAALGGGCDAGGAEISEDSGAGLHPPHPKRSANAARQPIERADTGRMLRWRADRVKFVAEWPRNSLEFPPHCGGCPFGASIGSVTGYCR